jgi:hypothetical protein
MEKQTPTLPKTLWASRFLQEAQAHYRGVVSSLTIAVRLGTYPGRERHVCG